MRTKTIIICLLLAMPAVASQADDKRPMTVEDLFSFDRVSSPALSPDGRWVAFTVTKVDIEENSSRTNIYIVPSVGGEPRRLTAGGADYSPVWSPDGETIAFVSARGGSAQIWLIGTAGGEARQLTSIPSGAGGPKWSPDGKRIIFSSMVWPDCDDDCYKKRTEERKESKVNVKKIDSLLYRHWNTWRDDGRKSHLFVVEVETGKHRDLMPGFQYDTPPFPFGGSGDYDISPDGKEVSFTAKVEPNPAVHTDLDVFTLPIEGGEPKNITVEFKGQDNGPGYSPDGRYIAYGAMARPRFEADQVEIILFDRETGDRKNLTADFDRTVKEWAWSPDSSTIYFVAADHGRNPIFSVPAAGGEVRRITGGGRITSLNVSPDGSSIVFARNCLSYPTELFAVEAGGGSETRLTFLTKPILDRLKLGEVKDLWFEGDGGDQVQVFLVFPPDFDPSRKWPLYQLLHGGPQQDYADLWTYGWNSQFFAAQGYVVALVAFHATPGYGQAFTDSVSKNWGGSPYIDVMKATDYLIEQGYIDGDRLVAGGGSYGGYLANWIATQTGRFKALVSHAGLFNLESEYGTTEELWFPEWELDGPYWENNEYYKMWSPHYYAANLGRFKTPVLVTHGQQDFRVPVSQGMEFFTALQRQGVPSRFLYFPEEDHWILSTQNQMLWYREVVDWFNKYAGGGPSE